MRRSLGRPHAIQLELFRPPPPIPDWTMLPEEIKGRTTIFIARMLREYQAARRTPEDGKEATNE